MNALMSQIEILSWARVKISSWHALKLRLETWILSCNFMWQAFFSFLSFHVTCTFSFWPFMMISKKQINVFYLTNKAFSFWVLFAHQNACDKHDFPSWQDLKSNILLVKNILRCVTKIETLGGVEIRGHLLKAYLWHKVLIVSKQVKTSVCVKIEDPIPYSNIIWKRKTLFFQGIRNQSNLGCNCKPIIH